MQTFLVSFGNSGVNYRYVRIVVEFVNVYNNVLQVIWLLNNLYKDCKMQRNVEILATRLKDKESFQFFRSFFRVICDM